MPDQPDHYQSMPKKEFRKRLRDTMPDKSQDELELGEILARFKHGSYIKLFVRKELRQAQIAKLAKGQDFIEAESALRAHIDRKIGEVLDAVYRSVISNDEPEGVVGSGKLMFRRGRNELRAEQRKALAEIRYNHTNKGEDAL